MIKAAVIVLALMPVSLNAQDREERWGPCRWRPCERQFHDHRNFFPVPAVVIPPTPKYPNYDGTPPSFIQRPYYWKDEKYWNKGK